MREINPRRLRLVHGNSNYGVLDGKEYIQKAIEALNDEVNAIVNPAPPGVWMVRPLNKSPQYRWEAGTNKQGKPLVRSQKISLAEASIWERRRAGREKKQKLEAAIQRLEEILFDLQM